MVMVFRSLSTVHGINGAPPPSMTITKTGHDSHWLHVNDTGMEREIPTSSSDKGEFDSGDDGSPEIEVFSSDRRCKSRKSSSEVVQKGLNLAMFQYKPLDDPKQQIRLLHIRSGAMSSPLICEMKPYCRSAAPQYHAISYTWGESWPMSAIFVNGQILMVRQNCQYALVQARLRTGKDCLVWIDAICIDQQNLSEKSCQVTDMGDIFAGAICVFACIGPLTDSVEYMFDTAKEIMDQKISDSTICDFCAKNNIWASEEFHLTHTWLDIVQCSVLDELAEAFDEFGNNEYWKRLWVIQEIALAREVWVLCGQKQVSLKALQLIHEMFVEISQVSRGTLASITSVKDLDSNVNEQRINANAFSSMCLLQRSCPGMDLEHNVHSLHKWKCEDARDRIFGILRLIEWPRDCGPPTPDYSIQPVDLAIDVLERLGPHSSSVNGRRWEFVYEVEMLLEGVGVDLDDPAPQRCARGPAPLPDTVNIDAFAADTYSSCTCDDPLMPRIAMELDMRHCATIYRQTSRTLFAVISSDASMHHVELESYEKDGGDFSVAKATNCSEATGVRIKFTSTVKAGDLLLEFEDWPLAPGGRYLHHDTTRFCLILRERKKEFYEIVGHAELYGKDRLFMNVPPRNCMNGFYSARETLAKRFTIHLDAEDAVAYVLSTRLDRGEEKFGGPPDYEPLHYISSGFGRTRFSSFVLRSDEVLVEPHRIKHVPNIDHRPTICARCGGPLSQKAGKIRRQDEDSGIVDML